MKKPFHLSRLVAVLGSAMALIMVVCFGVIVWVIGISSASLDAKQREGEQRLLLSVTNDQTEAMAKAVADYTSWNELYEYFEKPRDPNWTRENLGPYVTKTFGIDDVIAMSPKGTIAYFYSRKPHSDMRSRSATDRATLLRLAKLAFKGGNGVSGVVELNGVACLAAASPILMSSGNAPAHYVLIEVREFNRAFLDRLGMDYGIQQLRVGENIHNGLSLPSPDGRPSAFALTWKPSNAGHGLFARVLPAMIVTGGLALLALLGLALLLWRIAEHIR